MDDINWTRKKIAFILGGIAVFLILSMTPVNTSTVHLAMSEPSFLFATASEGDEDIQFSEDQIRFMNEAGERSLGWSAIADERLYCFTMDDSGNVQELHLADTIDDADRHSVSGGCYDIFGETPEGWAHTHPDYADELSDQDRDVGHFVEVTCIQYAEVQTGVGDTFHGLNCWDVDRSESSDDPDFVPMEIGLQE